MSMTLASREWTETPAVSVIIPCYNAAPTLAACVESVRSQDFPVTEVIVVDDASTDASAALAADLGVTLVRQPTNRGVSAARNTGAAAARGEILFFTDADGALAPDAVGNAVALLRTEPDCVCVHGMYGPEPLVDHGPVERYKTLQGYLWRRRAAGRVRTAFFALAAVRRDTFWAAGGFDERLRDSEDVEFSARLLRHPQHRRLGIRLTETVTGRHDEVDRLGPMLREQVRRSQLLLSMALAERRHARDHARTQPPDTDQPGTAADPAPAGRGDADPAPADPAAGSRAPRRLVANRPGTVLTGALTVAASGPALLAAAWLPPLAAVPVLLLALFLASDPGLFRAAAAHRGVRFLPVFIALHLLVQAAIVTGALVGAVHLLRPAVAPVRA